jgi:signal peptidase I
MQTVEAAAPQAGWIRRVLIGRDFKLTLVRIVIWVALLWVLGRCVLVPVRVNGISMLPTYQQEGRNFVNRLAYVFHEPRRGDVVAIRLDPHVRFPHLLYLKRVIGLPGETISFEAGHAYVDGEQLDEPYVKYPCHWAHDPLKLGPGEYYVVGDNRSMAWEDHEHGIATRGQIVGQPIW